MVDRDEVVEFVLDALRLTFNNENVRNRILRRYFKHSPNIFYGPTIEATRDDMDRIISTIKIFMGGEDSIFLFTLANIPKKNQTHFQSFIIDHINRTVWIIDPAFVSLEEEGIYSPYIARDVIETGVFDDYEIRWYKPSGSTCQTSYHDVFCQTWSLYVQVMSLMEGDLEQRKIYIPRDYERRFQKLLHFYIENLPLYCEDLWENYKIQINKRVKIKDQRDNLLRIKPCDIVRSMTVDDLYVEAHREEERKALLSESIFELPLDTKRRRY